MTEKRKVLLIESLILGLAGALITDLGWAVFLYYFLFGLVWFSLVNWLLGKREQKKKK